MHYWLTVVAWIFILWTNKGITESRPQDLYESNYYIDTGSWKPLPLTSGRIIPSEQPSIDQHNSRYKRQSQQLSKNFSIVRKNPTVNRLIFNYIKYKENNPSTSPTDKKSLSILQQLNNFHNFSQLLSKNLSSSYRKISNTNKTKIRSKHPSWLSSIQKVSTKPNEKKPTYNYSNPTSSLNTKPLPIIVNKKSQQQHSTYQIDTANPYEIIPVTSSNPSVSGTSTNKCPTVYITALTTLNESNTIYSREGCSDLKIIINSQIHNHNVITNDNPTIPTNINSKPAIAATDNSIPLNVQNDISPNQDPGTDVAATSANNGGSSGGTTNINFRPPLRPPSRPNQDNDVEDDDPSLFTTIIDSIAPSSNWLDTLNPILGVLLTPLSVIAAGGLSLLVFLFPYSIPSLLISRSSRKYPQRDTDTGTLKYEDYINMNIEPQSNNGWYWHDGYQTWSNNPPKDNEHDRKRRKYLYRRRKYDHGTSISPYQYYGDRGKNKNK